MHCLVPKKKKYWLSRFGKEYVVAKFDIRIDQLKKSIIIITKLKRDINKSQTKLKRDSTHTYN